jgi:hypothetical protein
MFEKLFGHSFYVGYQIKYKINLLLYLLLLLVVKLPEVVFIEDNLSYYNIIKLTNQLTKAN